MERSIKITRGIMDVLKPFQEMFEQLKKQQRQLPITMFFKKSRAVDGPIIPAIAYSSETRANHFIYDSLSIT
jgi:hypothetical protein